MEWIKIEDRLPELDKSVLVYDTIQKMEIGQFTICEDIICFTDLQHYPIMISDADITHWMPLPEPPKK